MAVTSNVYTPEFETTYVGCVLRHYEVNGYHDSDWYAEVWDEASGTVKTILYDTTRAGGSGKAEIDITQTNLRKVYASYRKPTIAWLDAENARIAATPQKGKRVRIIGGDVEGDVFWVGEGRWGGVRVGIRLDNGNKQFAQVNHVEVIGPEQYIVRGKARKQVIKRALVNKIPSYLRQEL
ncbi:hypothetical protein D3C75_262550 [compost metagenome]